MLGFSILIVLYLIFYIILIIGWRITQDSNPAKVDSNIKPSELTVVVPFRNECDNLSTLLTNINTLKTLPTKFIFIDDHSEDDWSVTFENINNDLIEVYSLNESDYGKKTAIQEGVKHAATKYIYYVGMLISSLKTTILMILKSSKQQISSYCLCTLNRKIFCNP
jgi:hypothetical protein